jgi:hypothetical protein
MSVDGIWTELRRLDAMLATAVAAAERAYGSGRSSDAFRGLHIGPGEVSRLLAREPGTPVLRAEDAAPEAPDAGFTRLSWLADAYGLSPFERDTVLVALAPEVDLRYERLYAYLQDDVTRRRPTVDLALNLLSASAEEKLARRRHFSSGSPLLEGELLQLLPDPTQPDPPLLAHALKLDEQVVRLLLEDGGLDSRLAGATHLEDPERWSTGSAMEPRLQALAVERQKDGRPLRVHVHGPDALRRRAAAAAVATARGTSLLLVDAALLPGGHEALERVLPVALREAWFHDAVLCVDGADRLWDPEGHGSWPRAAAALARYQGPVVLGSTEPLGRNVRAAVHEPLGLVSLAVPAPNVEERRVAWQSRLHEAGADLPSRGVDALADRFALTTGQIAEVVASAQGAAGADGPAPSALLPALFAAARETTALGVGGLARRIHPRRGADELVLPDDTLAQLRELCQRAAHSRRVLRDWGFGDKLSLGRGTTALFAGPSGTGKTMAAEVIAGELGLDLYKVDLSGVVSKWIGETEKNLDRVFRAAESGSGVLFFDEADALFGKRSEVHDSHDRYANVEIAYLLQRMEEHDGVAILATNLRANLDDAFIRRLAFVVHFPFPDEAHRLHIWRSLWPKGVPTEGLELPRLAHELPFTGGNIRNVALAAAYLAACDGGVVRMEHVRHAVRREFQKMGKNVPVVRAS